MDRAFQVAVREFSTIYRDCLNTVKKYQAAAECSTVYFPELRQLQRKADDLKGQWQERAFFRAHFRPDLLRGDVASLTPKIGVVTFSTVHSKETVEIYDPFSLSIYNSLRCAIKYWPDLSEDEQMRLLEMVVGVVQAKRQFENHRTLENVTYSVLEEIKNSPAALFSEQAHAIHSAQTRYAIQDEIEIPLMRQTRGVSPMFVLSVLRRVDRLYRPKIKPIQCEADAEGSEDGQLKAWSDSTAHRDPQDIFIENERFQELIRKFPPGQQAALIATMTTTNRKEATRQYGAALTTHDTQIQRARQFARKSEIPEFQEAKKRVDRAQMKSQGRDQAE